MIDHISVAVRTLCIASRLLIQNPRYFLPKPMAIGQIPDLGKAQRREHSGIEPLGDHPFSVGRFGRDLS
jgi:hypothetical protein